MYTHDEDADVLNTIIAGAVKAYRLAGNRGVKADVTTLVYKEAVKRGLDPSIGLIHQRLGHKSKNFGDGQAMQEHRALPLMNELERSELRGRDNRTRMFLIRAFLLSYGDPKRLERYRSLVHPEERRKFRWRLMSQYWEAERGLVEDHENYRHANSAKAHHRKLYKKIDDCGDEPQELNS